MRAGDRAKSVGDIKQYQAECQGNADHAIARSTAVHPNFGCDSEHSCTDGKKDQYEGADELCQ